MAPDIDEPTKAEILNKKLTEIIERELLLQDAAARLGETQGLHGRTQDGREQGVREAVAAPAHEGQRQDRPRGVQALPARPGHARRDDPPPVGAELHRHGVHPLAIQPKHRDDRPPRGRRVLQQVFAGLPGRGHRSSGRTSSSSRPTTTATPPPPAASPNRSWSASARAKTSPNSPRSSTTATASCATTRASARPEARRDPASSRPSRSVFGLKEKEVGPLIENEAGFHIIRLTKRTYAGTKKLDDECRSRSRTSSAARSSRTEMKQIIIGLKARRSSRSHARSSEFSPCDTAGRAGSGERGKSGRGGV